MWLLATVGLIALWRSAIGHRRRADGACWFAVGSLVGGGILFLPWVAVPAVPVGAHGYPVGRLVRPTTVLLVTIVEFAGRAVAEPQLSLVRPRDVDRARASFGDGR